MKLILFIITASLILQTNAFPDQLPGGSHRNSKIHINLNLGNPSKSIGVFRRGGHPFTFPVGFGKHGVLCDGARFRDGYTLLGSFRVNAILSRSQFEMTPMLLAQSGKSKEYLQTHLFQNMSDIDFDGNGAGKEYGSGYISLKPISPTRQPFAFHTFSGKFRWYSFAIHGTDNSNRVGQKVTGGCVNVDQYSLEVLLAGIELGDEVEITADGSLRPEFCETNRVAPEAISK